MKTSFFKILELLLVWSVLMQATSSGAFSSMYVFGDGVSATYDPTTPESDPLFHGRRNCNGSVWVEVLWKWQGHVFDDAKNRSAFQNLSEDVLVDTMNFTPPSDVATALFVIWCANADFVEFLSTEGTDWASFINASINRHVQAVANLYDKGARNIVMPNAADIMAVPFYNEFPGKALVRQKVIEFNTAFAQAMVTLAASKPGLVIHRPDVFSFFDGVLANPTRYGLVNPVPLNAAAYDLPNADKQSGPGIDYVFWDDYHPTAKFQMHLANFFKEVVFPTKVKSVSLAGGNVQLQVANIPLDRAGSIQGSPNLQPPWSDELPISEPFLAGGGTTKTYSLPASGVKRFYRGAFPVVWTWP